MNLKVFAVAAAVVLVVTAFTMINLAKPVAAKCFTGQSKDRASTIIVCDIGTKEQIDGLKKECKETNDNKEVRCSSSQTGNGELSPNK